MMKESNIEWNSLPEGKVVSKNPLLWVVRTGVVVNKPKKQKKYEDSNISLSFLEGEANSVLGYVLQIKKEFHSVFCQDAYVSFMSDVEKHTKPVVVYKDQKVYLYKYNTNKNPSYWFLVRTRSSNASPVVETTEEV